MEQIQSSSWLPYTGAGLVIIGIGVTVIGLSRLLSALVILFLAEAVAGPSVGPTPLPGVVQSALTVLDAGIGIGILLVGVGLVRMGRVLRRGS